MAVDAPLPGVGRQKSFIIENAGRLNRETKLAILTIVMIEIGPSAAVETNAARDVDIDLDAVAAASGEVLAHIYNIVWARVESLRHPAAGPAPSPPAGPLRRP